MKLKIFGMIICMLFIGASVVPIISGDIEIGINSPPNPPTITGSSSVYPFIPYFYEFKADDPDLDQIQYFIDWGDGTPTFITVHPTPSGEAVRFSHSFINFTSSTFYICAFVRDTYGQDSIINCLTVTMRKSKAIDIPLFLQQLFQRFPFLEKILNKYYN